MKFVPKKPNQLPLCALVAKHSLRFRRLKNNISNHFIHPDGKEMGRKWEILKTQIIDNQSTK